jgi:dihydroorotase
MSEGEILEALSPADFHVHLRQGTMSTLVVPHVAFGGFKLAYVMVCRPAHYESHNLTSLAKHKTPYYNH